MRGSPWKSGPSGPRKSREIRAGFSPGGRSFSTDCVFPQPLQPCRNCRKSIAALAAGGTCLLSPTHYPSVAPLPTLIFLKRLSWWEPLAAGTSRSLSGFVTDMRRRPASESPGRFRACFHWVGVLPPARTASWQAPAAVNTLSKAGSWRSLASSGSESRFWCAQ